MSIKSGFVTLAVEDGTTMQCYIAEPESGTGTHPGLLVFQEAFGVNHHIRDVADRFAAQGYVAIAPELFHRTAPVGFEGGYTDFPSVMSHIQATNAATIEADSKAAYNWLQDNPLVQKKNIASIGYCMGGRASFIANTALPLKAAVSYYGGGIAPDLIKKADSLSAPMLFFWGGLDKHIPKEQIDAVMAALTAANKPYINTVISYADHAFFCDARPAYNEQAAHESWGLTLAFLKEKLK